MGIDAFLVASSLSGVVAQRLVRVVCPHCSVEYTPSKSEQENVENKYLKLASTIKTVLPAKLKAFANAIIVSDLPSPSLVPVNNIL